eukprot:SAG31_NODE_4492_length_3188_cov_3.281716_2_plen_164_part_00
MFDVKKSLANVRTPYQHIEVFENPSFGKVLLIDGDLMLTERDEAAYHEMLAHVPLAFLPTAQSVLIIGGASTIITVGRSFCSWRICSVCLNLCPVDSGGDGGVCGQVLRHKNVQRVVVVDIDQQVVDVAREYFPKLAACYDDRRVEVCTSCLIVFLGRTCTFR